MTDCPDVYYWPSDTGACRFYRCALPAEALNATGTDAQLPEATRLDSWVKDDPDRLVVLQRSHNPQARTRLSRFVNQGRPFVFDVDDWLWGLEDDNPAFPVYANPAVRENLDWMAHNATVMTCSTEPLAQNISDTFNRDAHVIRNALPDRLITPDLEEREPVIFWRGSNTHKRDVQVLGPALRRLDAEGIRIVFAGADYRKLLGLTNAELMDDVVLANHNWNRRAAKHANMVAVDKDGEIIPAEKLGRRLGENRQQRRARQKANKRAGFPPKADVGVPVAGHRRAVWLPPGEYIEAVTECVRPTIAVAPLNDNTFNASKSEIAALEAQAAGAVVIASDVPAYREAVPPGAGFLVRNDPDDWYRALRDVLDMTHPEWVAAAEAGAAACRANSITSQLPAYRAAYREAVGST